MPAALQWLHRKRFQSAPNIKKPLKGPVIQANVNDQLHPLCPHKHHRRNNSNIFIINIIISKTNERLFMTCETKIPHELSHTRYIPVGRSLQSQGTRLASLAGRTTGLPALPPEKKSVKCCSFCISYWADSSQNRFKYLSFYPSPPDQYISDRDPWFHFKVLCVKFDLI